MKANKMSVWLIQLFFIVASACMVIPFLLVVSVSFTSENSLIHHGYQFIPHHLDLQAYRYIFKVPGPLLQAYEVTAIVTVVGTAASLLVTSMLAYSISRKDYKYRTISSFYVFFTMLFSGGLIPFYILVTQYLHLRNTIWAMILPGLLSSWNVLVLKGFFVKIPFEIIESAKMDGAREWRIFFTIMIPLSTPALSTMALLIAFNYWNEWFNAMLFIDNPDLVPLQLLLVRMLNNMEVITQNLSKFGLPNIDLKNFPTMSARMVMVILAAGPMMVVFPFFQRYFVQGLTVGSLKG